MSTVIDEKTSLLDSAIGPVSITTTEHTNFDVDDYVTLTVQSKAEYLRIVAKAATMDPLQVRGKPVVTVGGSSLGGFDAV